MAILLEFNKIRELGIDELNEGKLQLGQHYNKGLHEFQPTSSSIASLDITKMFVSIEHLYK